MTVALPEAPASKQPAIVMTGCHPTPINSVPAATPAPPVQNSRRRPHTCTTRPTTNPVNTEPMASKVK